METPQVKIPWQPILIFFSLLLLLFLFPPFLQNGLILGHDLFLHSAYMHAFDNALFQGQFPVRVIDWFFPGANVPLFNFYQPGFFYFTALLKLLGLSYSIAFNGGLLLLWLGSGIAMFLFVRERLHHTLAALFAGLLYIFAPYHIVDVFVRAAFPEFMALTIVPIWFWAVTRFVHTRNNRWLVISAASIAGLILTHPPTALMFAPLIAVYMSVLAWEHNFRSTVLKLAGSEVAGGLLSAFFLLPALLEQKYIHFDYAMVRLFDFHNHFVCVSQLFTPSWGYGLSVAGCNDTISFQVGMVHWIALLLAVGIIAYKQCTSARVGKEKNFVLAAAFLAVFIAAIFMELHISLPVWEHFPLVHFILYPWRFLSVNIFVVSFVSGYGLSLLKKNAAYIIYALGIYGIFYWYVPYLHANTTDADANGFNSTQYLVNDPEFRTTRFVPEILFFPKIAKTFPNPQTIPQSEAAILRGSGTVNRIDATATTKNYTVSLQKTSTLRFYLVYFPGWSVIADGKVIPVSYTNPSGYMDTVLPAGNHSVKVAFSDTPIRRSANMLSFLTLILMPFIYWGKLRSAVTKKVTKFWTKKSER